MRAACLRESLASWIGALSERAPVVLLIDDLQRAGPALFKFLGLLFAQERHGRLLVLATARTGTVGNSARLDQFLAALEPFECLDRLPLAGLEETSVARLLAQVGVAQADTKARALFELTAGHPFYIGELLQSDGWESAIPSSVRDFVRIRAHELGRPEKETLECAAGFSTSFDVALLADAAEVMPTIASMHLNRAVGAGFVRPAGTATFVFTHELTRRALLESIEPDRAARLHRRIALALETRGEPASVLALHWRLVSDEHARAQTYRYARDAARDALGGFEPETAAVWLHLALESATSARDEGHALLALAEAQYQASDPDCAASLRAAIERARALDDDELLVACATTWTPIWTSAPPLEADERIRLLSDAVAVAGDDARGIASARLATELAHLGNHSRARVLATDALGAMGRGASAAAKAEVALRYVHTMWSPHSLTARRAILQDLLTTVAPDDVVNRCSVLAFVAATAAEAAELAEADSALAEMLLLAEDHSMGVLEVNAMTSRAGVPRSRAIWTAQQTSQAKRGPTLFATATGERPTEQRCNWRISSGSEGARRTCFRSPSSTPRRHLRAGSCARVALPWERHRKPRRATFEALTTAELCELPHDLFWSSTLIAAAEAAFMLDLPELGAAVHDLLEPFRYQLAFANFAIAPIAYGAGLAAAASHRIEYESLFADALAICARLHAPVLRARTEIAFADRDLH